MPEESGVESEKVNKSFTDAKIAENDVENVLDVHPARDPSQKMSRSPQFLRKSVFAPSFALGNRPYQSLIRGFQESPLSFPGDERGLA